ncbi:MAG: T9SS type A sorting domain-containing protein, partial [Candidatus Eisenbacteria bacterium]|nr:T9SS type A sorting domain-containing protein [Candidatus Eisenbacteria bacterium]
TNASGSIPCDGTVDVTVSINSNANSLGNGEYTDVVQFVNETDHSGDTSRNVTLTVGAPSLVYEYPLDSDPGWSTQGLWAHGTPTGGGGQYGNEDPTSGHTGSSVYGYNLSGDYENGLPERHLTTDAIDCSNLSSVSLKFWRWLNVERNLYDHAYLRVSNDGTTWTTVWENGSSHVEDSSWSQFEYDIASVADGQETVYIRWTMGETDGSWQFSGWNIDDVEIWGIEDTQSGVDEAASGALALSPNYPNPFGPSTTVRFELPEPARVSLRVYDVSGRLVRELADAQMPAGSHVRTWDGRDGGGRPVAAGVYFCRFEAGEKSRTRRMVLVR